MFPNDTSTPDGVSTADHPEVPVLTRRRTLSRVAAVGASASLLGTAAGSASAGGLDEEIVLKALGEGATYRIEVSDEIEKGPRSGADDEVEDDDTVVGEIAEKHEYDDYRYSGEITAFGVTEGEVKVWVNDEKVDPDELGDRDPDREIAIHAEGPHVDYEFVVSAAVEAGPEADIGVGDAIDDGVVTGNVAGSGVDDYRFADEIAKFHTTDDDEVTVTVDDDEVDPADLGGYQYVSIHAEGPHVDYEFEVSGDVDPASEADIGVGDAIDDGVVTGNVAGSGVDSYWFTGELTGFDVSRDDVTVRVDGDAIDVSSD